VHLSLTGLRELPGSRNRVRRERGLGRTAAT